MDRSQGRIPADSHGRIPGPDRPHGRRHRGLEPRRGGGRGARIGTEPFPRLKPAPYVSDNFGPRKGDHGHGTELLCRRQ
jgi:hypothetical protein